MLRRLGLFTLFSFVSLAACAPAHAPIEITSTLPVEQFRLANGLAVVLNPDPNAHAAFVHLRYHSGTKDDPPGKRGLAHLVEHLGFGVEALPGETVAASYERIGSRDMNAGVSLDTTDYVATVPSELLDHAILVEAKRLAHLGTVADDAPALERERGVVANELRTRATWSPAHLASMLARTHVFGSGHPYGRADAEGETVATLDSADVRGFVERHYTTANARLVVSGRFDPKHVSEVVASAFGPAPRKAAPPRQTHAPAHVPRNDFVVYRAPIPRTTLAIAWSVPLRETDAHEALVIASRSIEASVRHAVTTELPVADDVRVVLAGGKLGCAFVILTQLRAGASSDVVLARVERTLSHHGELGRIQAWDDFDALRLSSATRHMTALEPLDGRSERIHDDLDVLGYVRTPADTVARRLRITASDAGSAVKQYLVAAARVVVAVTPDPSAPVDGARK